MSRWVRKAVVAGGVVLVTVAILAWWLVPRVWNAGEKSPSDATTASEPPPQVPAGPPREPRELLWSAPRSAEEQAVAAGGGFVVVAHGDGFVVHEALTGQRRWHYRIEDTPVLRVAAGGGRVAATFWPPGGDEDVVELRVFDLTTGRALWSRDIPREVDLSLLSDVVVIGPIEFGDSTVAELRAYRAKNGRPAWSRPAPCGAYAVTGGGTLAVSMECGGLIPPDEIDRERDEDDADGLDTPSRTTVGVLDPATGRTRWEHTSNGESRLMATGARWVMVVRRGVDVPEHGLRYELTGYTADSGERLARSTVVSNGLPAVIALERGWCAMAVENIYSRGALRCYDDTDGQPRWTRKPQQYDMYTFVDLRPGPNAETLAVLGEVDSLDGYAAVLFDAVTGKSRLVELPGVRDAQGIVSFAHGALVVTGRGDDGSSRVFIYGDLRE